MSHVFDIKSLMNCLVYSGQGGQARIFFLPPILSFLLVLLVSPGLPLSLAYADETSRRNTMTGATACSLPRCLISYYSTLTSTTFPMLKCTESGVFGHVKAHVGGCSHSIK